jgi:L-threonylcarbamoyladenylate synthase
MYFSPLAMRELVSGLGERSRQAVAQLLPGPVTLVIANPERRYPLASRDDPERLGVRLIEGPLAGTMIPIFQTSANRSGSPAPRSFEEIDDEVLASADMAIDGGEELIGAPSTVIDLAELDSAGRWEVLREGALPRGVIDRVLGDTASGR